MSEQPAAVATPLLGRRALVVAILMGVLGVAFEAYAVLAAMPLAAEDLGGLDLYAWTFTMFVTGQVLATVIAGRVSDRLGPIPALAVGFVVFAVFLIAAGFAPSMLVLLIARFGQGVGAGALNLSLMVLIAEAFTEAERPTLMMLFSFCWVGPSFFGPPLSAWLATHLSWHWVFWAPLPLLGLAAILGLRPVRAAHAAIGRNVTAASTVPLWAAFVAAIGAATVQFAAQQLSSGEEGVPSTPMPLGLVGALAAIGLVALVASVPRLMPPGVLTLRPGLASVMWTRAVQAGSFFVVESFLPLILHTQRGLTVLEAGSALTVGAVGWTLGSWLQARPWLGRRRDRIIIAGAAQAIVGALVMVWFTATPTLPVWVGLVGYVIHGCGMGFTVTSTSLATMTLSDAAQLGRNTSSLQVGEGLGNALLVGAAGAVYAALRSTSDAEVTFSAMLCVSLLGAVLALVAALRVGPVRNEVSDAAS